MEFMLGSFSLGVSVIGIESFLAFSRYDLRFMNALSSPLTAEADACFCYLAQINTYAESFAQENVSRISDV